MSLKKQWIIPVLAAAFVGAFLLAFVSGNTSDSKLFTLGGGSSGVEKLPTSSGSVGGPSYFTSSSADVRTLTPIQADAGIEAVRVTSTAALNFVHTSGTTIRLQPLASAAAVDVLRVEATAGSPVFALTKLGGSNEVQLKGGVNGDFHIRSLGNNVGECVLLEADSGDDGTAVLTTACFGGVSYPLISLGYATGQTSFPIESATRPVIAYKGLFAPSEDNKWDLGTVTTKTRALYAWDVNVSSTLEALSTSSTYLNAGCITCTNMPLYVARSTADAVSPLMLLDGRGANGETLAKWENQDSSGGGGNGAGILLTDAGGSAGFLPRSFFQFNHEGSLMWGANAGGGTSLAAYADLELTLRDGTGPSHFGPTSTRSVNLGRASSTWNDAWIYQVYASNTATGALTSTNATSTNLDVNTRLSVAGQSVCLVDGTNCPAGVGSQGLNDVINVNKYATTTPSFFGGMSVGSTLTSTGTADLQLVSFTNGTGTGLMLGNGATANVALGVGNDRNTGIYSAGTDVLGFAAGGAGISWDGSAFKPNTTAVRDLGTPSQSFMNGYASGTLYALVDVKVGSSYASVCLVDGTNCPASGGSQNLTQVSNIGAFTATTTMNLFGGLNIGGALVSTSSLAVTGSSTVTTLNFTSATGSRVAVAQGSATNPAFTFDSDSNTGFYDNGGDTIGLTTNGSQAASITNVTAAFNGVLRSTGGQVDAQGTSPYFSWTDSTSGDNDFLADINSDTWNLRNGAGGFPYYIQISTGTNVGIPNVTFPVGATSSDSFTTPQLFVTSTSALANATATTFAITSRPAAGTGLNPACFDANGNVTEGAAGVCPVSALAVKENLEDISYGLTELRRIGLYDYTFKGELYDGRTHSGVVADWAGEVMPNLVLKNEKGEVIGWDQFSFSAVLAKSIQELATKNDEQDGRLDALEAENLKLQQKIIQLEKLILNK